MIPSWNPERTELQELAHRAALGEVLAWSLVRRHNDVWKLRTASGTFYVKAYSKAWYGDDLPATAACVQHEAAAHTILQKHEAWVERTPHPLGRAERGRQTLLLLSELPGQPLTRLLRAAKDDPAKQQAWLVLAEQFMGRMHDIAFGQGGYLMTPGGPQTAPDPSQWGHPA